MVDKPHLLVCPKCRRSYLGKERLPDCPYCGYDYRNVKEGFRWDLLFFLMVIIALLFFVLVSVSYRGAVGRIGRSAVTFPGEEGTNIKE